MLLQLSFVKKPMNKKKIVSIPQAVSAVATKKRINDAFGLLQFWVSIPQAVSAVAT